MGPEDDSVRSYIVTATTVVSDPLMDGLYMILQMKLALTAKPALVTEEPLSLWLVFSPYMCL